MSSIIEAILSKNFSVVNAYLANGGDINRSDDGYSRLLMAVTSGNIAICRILVDRYGANVNFRYAEGLCAPIHAAAEAGYKDICSFLIFRGASIDMKAQSSCGFSLTPLDFAVTNPYRNHETIKLLIEHGAEVPRSFELSDYGKENFSVHIFASKWCQDALYKLTKNGRCIRPLSEEEKEMSLPIIKKIILNYVIDAGTLKSVQPFIWLYAHTNIFKDVLTVGSIETVYKDLFAKKAFELYRSLFSKNCRYLGEDLNEGFAVAPVIERFVDEFINLCNQNGVPSETSVLTVINSYKIHPKIFQGISGFMNLCKLPLCSDLESVERKDGPDYNDNASSFGLSLAGDFDAAADKPGVKCAAGDSEYADNSECVGKCLMDDF